MDAVPELGISSMAWSWWFLQTSCFGAFMVYVFGDSIHSFFFHVPHSSRWWSRLYWEGKDSFLIYSLFYDIISILIIDWSRFSVGIESFSSSWFQNLLLVSSVPVAWLFKELILHFLIFLIFTFTAEWLVLFYGIALTLMIAIYFLI